MGQSITLLKKEFLELSLEIDRGVMLEMSTGFGHCDRVTTSAAMPITVDELKKVIDLLTEMYDSLKESWTCSLCKIINRKEWTECNNCEAKRC